MQRKHKSLHTLFQRLFIVMIFLMVLGPFIWTLLISLQDSVELNSSFAVLLTRDINLDNYRHVLSNSRFVAGLRDSLIISVLSVIINIIISVPAGFALARVKMPLTKIFLRIMLTFVFVPILLLAVPVRQMLLAWGFKSSYWMVVLPMSVLVMTTMTFWSFYARFPDEMDDCSVMLGMTPIQGFFRIYLPVSGKMIAYAAVLQFVTTWNCAFMPMFMYREPHSIIAVQESLLQFALMPSQIFNGMVAVLITCLPCWLLYLVRYKLGKDVDSVVGDPYRDA